MTNAVRLRFIVLLLAVAAMGAAIAASMVHFQRQTRELHTRLANIDAESGQIAAQFKDRFRDITNTRLQYAVTRDPAAWRHFLQATAALSQWIDQQGQQLRTQEERDVLKQVKAALQDYDRTIGQIPGEPNLATEAALPAEVHPPVANSADGLAAYNRIRTESHHLFDLGESLASAHFRSRNELLRGAQQRLDDLRWSVLGLLGLLFLAGVAFAAVAYRDLIAPLRVKLIESQSLVDRQEKLASLGMLAAGVAHEIRNPLTAIKAALFIQQKRFAAGSPEHADSALVQREISRLEKIVNDFLRFARPADPALATIGSDELLREVQQFFAPGLEKAGIKLVVETDGRSPIQVDAAQMKQVLINLVQNAVDAMERSGTITLRSRRDRKPLGGNERDVVILEVEDTGRGIPPEVGRRLFDPFFTTKDHGTGLGLSIAARIVEKHRGALQYQTQVSRGTTFGVVLPEATS
ncbi:MAG TPA: ATP-binding protein [Opitutaceae bacterium]|nr:ATP-binding protein [Opitutaceae bacterium]